MILRIAAALALAFGFALTLAYLHRVGKGPFAPLAARHLREMKDRRAQPEQVQPTSYAAMEALPRLGSVAEYSALERRAAHLEGYVQQMVRAADHDIHVELTQHPKGPEDGNSPYVTGEITPQWRLGSEPWTYDALAALMRPNWGGTTAWESGPRRVRLTGWLLYDYEYEGRSHWGPPRITHWELHPITRIEWWDPARGAFVEHAR